MSDNKKSCDLCGLPVEVSGFELKTGDGLGRNKRVYRLAMGLSLVATVSFISISY